MQQAETDVSHRNATVQNVVLTEGELAVNLQQPLYRYQKDAAAKSCVTTYIMIAQCCTSSTLHQHCLAPDQVARDYMTVLPPATAEATGSAAAADKGPLLLVCSTSKISNCVIWYDKT